MSKEHNFGQFILTADYPSYKATIEVRGDAPIDEVVEALKAFMLAAGYGAETVKDIFAE